MSYDLIFLDIDMPIIGGIETGKYVNSIDVKAIIIFITSYPQYAIDAFDCSAFHYLLKPCDYDKFYTVLKKAVEKYILFHRNHVIQTKEGPVKLALSDIYYIECWKKHILYHTTSKTYTVRGTLSEVISELSEFGFYQTHQGYIVNFEKVAELQKFDIVLSNGEKVMMSVRKRTDVINAFESYLERYS